MALRDQPYIPLYVQDFLTDEKLIECSAVATGVYIRLICIMHKSETYGTILLKQKDKQHGKRIVNFAYKLAKQMPYDVGVIISALTELFSEGVIHCRKDYLYQKRMVRDNQISIERSKAGRKGGLKTQFAKTFAKAKNKAKAKAKLENETENEIKNDTVDKKGRHKNPKPPKSIDEVIKHFEDNGYSRESAIKAYKYYEESDPPWHDQKGDPVLSWRSKMRVVWFKDENKIKKAESKEPKMPLSIRCAIGVFKEEGQESFDRYCEMKNIDISEVKKWTELPLTMP